MVGLRLDWIKNVNFSLIFLSGWAGWAVGLDNLIPTPEPNMVGLVKFHSLFIRRVNEFDRIQVGSGQISQVR